MRGAVVSSIVAASIPTALSAFALPRPLNLCFSTTGGSSISFLTFGRGSPTLPGVSDHAAEGQNRRRRSVSCEARFFWWLFGDDMVAYICLRYERRIAYIGAYMGVEHPLFAWSSSSKDNLGPSKESNGVDLILLEFGSSVPRTRIRTKAHTLSRVISQKSKTTYSAYL